MAWRPRFSRRSRLLRRILSGVRHSARRMLHTRSAATMTMPSASAKTGSEV
jgi:hypothetical protein